MSILQNIKNNNPSDIWNTSYCTIQAVQAWQDLMLWEGFLNFSEPKAIVEIGTLQGGLSLYLKHQADSRKAKFFTIDFQKYCDFSRFPNSTLLPHFIHADVWDKKTVEPLIADNSNKPLALLCDGGNKPKEMQTFTPLLSVGDFAIVHDWGNEVSDADLVGLPIEMILRQECESLKSLTRFFKRI